MKKYLGAYQAGYDAELNGGNDENCHFSWFMSAVLTEQWQEGANDAKRQSRRICPICHCFVGYSPHVGYYCARCGNQYEKRQTNFVLTAKAYNYFV